jgi:hypothetical protein
MGLSEKKERELRAFYAACQAGLPIRANSVDARGENPDLRVTTPTGIVGIELSEILPLPRNPSFNSPVAEASLQEDSVRLAEQIYCGAKDAIPVRVTVYPWSVERTRNRKRKMANALANFVKEHGHEATPVKLFERLDGIPEGFGVVNICAGPGPWQSGQSTVATFDGIYTQLAIRIAEKNELLPTYRANLPNAPIWLLLHSCWEVARSVPMPHGIREWSQPFCFDRVFFFAASSDCIEGIQHREAVGEVSLR